MKTVPIEHKSRDFSPTLNFAASENTLSWTWQQEGDGEIYLNPLTMPGMSSNVASLKIEGVVPVYPLSILSGVYYQISITKITNGLPASVTINTRRITNKSIVINVPDYSLPGNGFLYSLLNNNTIIKRDPLLLITPNYIGGGVWSTTSIVATISLPTNGGLINWKYINHDVSDIICWGRLVNETVTSDGYVCRIKPDGSVWDYYGTVLNGYTTLGGLYNATSKKYPYSIANDYVNGYFVISPLSSSGASNGIIINKNTLSALSFLAPANSARQMYFNPQRSVIPLVGDVKCPDNQVTNVFFVNNYTGQSAYSINKALTLKANANSYAIIWGYNAFGNTTGSYSCVGTGEAGNGVPGNIVINKRLDLVLSMSVSQSSFAYSNLTGTQVSRRITTFSETGLGSRYIAVNERSSQFFATLSHASHQDKILVIDPLDANIEIGYIVESAPILCVTTNNYY